MGSSIVGSEVLLDIDCARALREAFKNHLRVSITTLTTIQDALLVRIPSYCIPHSTVGVVNIPYVLRVGNIEYSEVVLNHIL
ncbi:hypothetical protein PNOK_0174300 [Pyrrhoderma noxium]|uniref:Uncharacterized protein n=1 Tax=Pyrrhoderma noxium TaxID=2282107 RepID=A0A286UQB8_9AGAM|nr:hypothetical protein PNOK_0174200 [Pyrrhoderma noxium]PAV21786.1 hypothetical protein PNOK_0174300 [Pyrrhoderma noxium]